MLIDLVLLYLYSKVANLNFSILNHQKIRMTQPSSFTTIRLDYPKENGKNRLSGFAIGQFDGFFRLNFMYPDYPDYKKDWRVSSARGPHPSHSSHGAAACRPQVHTTSTPFLGLYISSVTYKVSSATYEVNSQARIIEICHFYFHRFFECLL